MSPLSRCFCVVCLGEPLGLSGSRGRGLARRPLLKAAAGLGAAGFVCAATAALAGEPFDLAERAPGIFTHPGVQEDFTAANEGGIANLALIVGRNQAAIVDTGGCLRQGQAFLAAVRRATSLPISHVILTHAHPDHVFGNAAFQAEGTVFVGHEHLPRAMAERGPAYLANMRAIMGDVVDGTLLVAPTRTVASGKTDMIDLGGRVLELQAWPTAHTDCDLTVRVPDADLLLAGDLVTVRRLPVVDGSIKGWLQIMDALAALPAGRVLPGHGPISAWPQALGPVRDYLDWLHAGVARLQDKGVEIDAIVDALPLPAGSSWLVTEDVHPRNVIAVYKELEWE